MTLRSSLIALFVFGATVGGGCSHYKVGPGPLPSSSPTSGPTASPTPGGQCQSLLGTTTQIVDVSQGIASIIDPTYGPILGYALDPQNGTFPNVASTIALRPSNLIQFANIDVANPYSAVGFGTSHFPAVPYTFPAGTQNPIGSALGSAQWSTGRIAAATAGFVCFSQQFTLSPVSGGNIVVVYFGDYDHYNSTNGTFRDVIIVSNSAPQVRSVHRKLNQSQANP
jgi:hypothetical protein